MAEEWIFGQLHFSIEDPFTVHALGYTIVFVCLECILMKWYYFQDSPPRRCRVHAGVAEEQV